MIFMSSESIIQKKIKKVETRNIYVIFFKFLTRKFDFRHNQFILKLKI